MTEELYQILQEYARGKDGDIAKKDTPRGTPEGTPAPDQPQGLRTGRGSKRQRKEYAREVNVIGTFTPTPPPKWSSVPISFTEEDAKGIRFPHDDALFVTIVSNCELKKILVDGGSSADILYLSMLKKLMEPQGGYKNGSLQPSLYPLSGFVPGKSIQPLGQIELLTTFGDATNHRTELVRFDVMDMEASFNAILGRMTLNRLCAAVHHNFL
ncbi:uncharacterized protein LOC100838958 [Brachypodium distachyon]|uniref:uncharacterized protein LOC100838958 n=1 Tax=Brachypodium distachyon TaxID=15368 RepID=UPI00052FE0D7|nr:uncharacterized protein LOC100838958 [Brachypodium distachyon]|eukprot:XP_010229878.1 uncharacterized protein LOC100838958 [Brachypodium distachyon]